MLIIATLCVIALGFIWHLIKKPARYPPGPWGIPLFGNLRGVTSLESRLHDLKKKFGDIFCWRIGTKLIVVLTDFDLIKEAFQSDHYTDRPDLPILDTVKFGQNYGIAKSNGHQWQNARRFTLRQMRDLGMGKAGMVSEIQFEASQMVTYMNQETGKSVLVTSLFVNPVLNVIWQMVASTKFNPDTRQAIDFDRTLKLYELTSNRQSMSVFFPWIDYVLPKVIVDKIAHNHITLDVARKLTSYFKESVENHRKVLDSSNPKDFIDEYLLEMERKKSEPYSSMSEKDMISCIADLFFGGSQPLTKTLQFSLLTLASFPNVQKKLQHEIDSVIPKGSHVTLEDKSRLPYTEAFIHESFRFSTVLPNSLLHCSTKETELAGYIIPKGSFMLSFLESVHFNPKYFDNPHEFRPERFLDGQGKFCNPKEGFMPFGIGKRQCLGESLARMEVYIFLTTMIQNFTFAPPPGKVIDLSPMRSPLMNMPKEDQEIVFYSR